MWDAEEVAERSEEGENFEKVGDESFRDVLRMPEGKQWVPMSGGNDRNFGVYRERDKPRITGGTKVLLVLACLSAFALIIFFTTLSITKGKNRLESVFQRMRKNDTEKFEYKMDRKIDIVSENDKTETENRIKFPDDDEDEIPLENLQRQGKSVENRRGPKRVENQFEFSQDFPQLDKFKNFKVQNIIANPMLTIMPNGQPAVKFTGVYFKTNEDEEFPVRKEPVNGHAYGPDPFKPYKPSHPSEINHLATFTSEIDTGPRFSNKIVRPTKSPPVDSASSSQTQMTQSIFHHYDFVPGASLRPEKKPKPLKIMLDIYPVNPTLDQNGKPGSSHSNRMIVHLNLYPKKSKNKRHQQLLSLVPGNIEDRMFVDENDESEFGIHLEGEASRVEIPDDVNPLENFPAIEPSSGPDGRTTKEIDSAEKTLEIDDYESPINDYVFEQEELNGHSQNENMRNIERVSNNSHTALFH